MQQDRPSRRCHARLPRECHFRNKFQPAATRMCSMSSSATNAALPAGGRRPFATTRWSIVLAAGKDSSPDSHAALVSLCEAYWYPLYAYIRRRGYDADEAQDLTQEFFTRLLEKKYVKAADPQRGKFRSFLLASLNHFLANEWRREQAQKRGGGQRLLSLDFADGEGRL